jgi:hypothetical protein
MYGFTDVDGSTPNWGRHAASHEFSKDQDQSHLRYLGMFAPVRVAS